MTGLCFSSKARLAQGLSWLKRPPVNHAPVLKAKSCQLALDDPSGCRLGDASVDNAAMSRSFTQVSIGDASVAGQPLVDRSLSIPRRLARREEAKQLRSEMVRRLVTVARPSTR